MPKRTPRVPGQPLAERPCDEPHIPEMLSRTLFRDGIHRQRGAPRKPRISIFTEDPQTTITHPPPSPHSVSPEDAPRAPGIVSPISPLTPKIPPSPPISIAVAPATPSSELGPGGHWYFHDVRNNHYEESRVSIGTRSECTTLGLCPEPGAPARVVEVWERGAGRWSVRGSVRKSVRGVRRWLSGRRERRAREKVEREREREGELVVRERVVLGGGREGDGSLGSDDSEKEGEGESKGARGKARYLVRKGTMKLRKLQLGSDDEGVPALPKKEAWKPMRRIKGFQHIE